MSDIFYTGLLPSLLQGGDRHPLELESLRHRCCHSLHLQVRHLPPKHIATPLARGTPRTWSAPPPRTPSLVHPPVWRELAALQPPTPPPSSPWRRLSTGISSASTSSAAASQVLIVIGGYSRIDSNTSALVAVLVSGCPRLRRRLRLGYLSSDLPHAAWVGGEEPEELCEDRRVLSGKDEADYDVPVRHLVHEDLIIFSLVFSLDFIIVTEANFSRIIFH